MNDNTQEPAPIEGLPFDEETLIALPSPNPEDPVDRADVIGEGGRWLAAWSGRFLLMAAALLAIGWIASKFWSGILPVLLALLFASVLWPLTAWLKKVGVPYLGGAAISLLGGFGILAGLVWAIAPSIASQWSTLSGQAVKGVQQLQAWVAGPPLNIRDDQLNEWINQGLAWLQARSGELMTQVMSVGGSIGSGVVTLLLTLVLTFFFLKDGSNFLSFTRRIVGRKAGFHATELLTRLWNTLSGYIRTQAIVSFVDAFFIGIGLALLGVPLAFPLAVITFMAGFIPMVGALTAGALAVLVALVSNGPYTALFVLILIVAVQQLEGNILQPLLQSRVMQLHPVVVLLAVLLGGVWGGIIGAFLSVPMAASVAVVLRYIGDLIDLRTGDRRAEDITWATDDGHTVAYESEKHAAFFRALVSRRTAKRHAEEGTDRATVELPGGRQVEAEGTGWLGKLMRRRPIAQQGATDSEATGLEPKEGSKA
ncbi:MAG: AI-2E family transporter [Propionibacteriaceae bacterium]|nr:AI-2E family transporter [Propionibacteriaceae bacterium]